MDVAKFGTSMPIQTSFQGQNFGSGTANYRDRAAKGANPIFGDRAGFSVNSPFLQKNLKGVLAFKPEDKPRQRRESAKTKKRAGSKKGQNLNATEPVFSPKQQLFNAKKLSYGGNDMFSRKTGQKKVYSRNAGLAGAFSSGGGLSDNWSGVGGARFRTQQLTGTSSNIYSRETNALNRTLNNALKKKKNSEQRMVSTVDGQKKSHSLPKKPKSGRQLSRNPPNAAIYSIQPKMTRSFKKRTKTAKREL